MPNITVAAAATDLPSVRTLPPPMIRGVLSVCRECSEKLTEEAGRHAPEVAKPFQALAMAIDRTAVDWAAEHGGRAA